MRAVLFIAGAVVLLAARAAVAARAEAQAAEGAGEGELLTDEGAIALEHETMLTTNLNRDQEERNLAAFLAMIRYAEGTAGENGYRTLFGGDLFEGYADHPRRRVTRKFGEGTLASTAAGAYQILESTWDLVRSRLALPDFSPASQDQAAIELIRSRGALEDVKAGRFELAVNKVRRVWASLPGAGYGQPERSLDRLVEIYLDRGGVIV